MDSFLNRKYNEFSNALQSILDASPMDDNKTANLRCNMAITLYELELYRKCIATSQKVLELDPTCLRASLLHAKSLNKLGRKNEAIGVCEEVLSNTNHTIYGDAYLAMELRDLKLSMIAEKMVNDTSSTHSPVTTSTSTPVSSKEITTKSSNSDNNTESKESSKDISNSTRKAPSDNELPLPSPPSSSSQATAAATTTATNATTPNDPSITPPVAPKSPPATASPTTTISTATAASASAVSTAIPVVSNNKNTSKMAPKKMTVVIDNSLTAVKHREALHQLLISSLNQSDTKVSPAVLRMVRSNLLCASGEDIVDDLIAFGYLQVNTNHLDKAIEVFAELLKYRSDLPAAHLGTGSAYAMMGQYEKAINAFTQAIAVSNPPIVLTFLSLTYFLHVSATLIPPPPRS